VISGDLEWLAIDFGWLAVVLPLAGFAAYVRDTWLGRTQPNRVSWALWTAGPMIAFAGELAQSVNLRVALVTLALGAGPAAVLVATFRSPAAYWHTNRFDWVCAGLGAAALIALANGLVTHRNTVTIAIALSIAADAAAAMPTIAKSWTHPESESVGTYVASGAGCGLTLLTLTDWTVGNYGFPAYVVIVCMLITVLVTRRDIAAWFRGPSPWLAQGADSASGATVDSPTLPGTWST
jgi:hypothetical protein